LTSFAGERSEKAQLGLENTLESKWLAAVIFPRLLR
jgi:hypothetical protein